jgi:lipopolysaccharide biosynthesis glycosyltransferase
MAGSFAVVFCSDQRGLPGLHVAAYSVLRNAVRNPEPLRICLFTDSLTHDDVELLRTTLEGALRPFSLEIFPVDVKSFGGLPSMRGSWAAYYRLYAAQVLDAARILYIDLDTLCDLDISPLESLPMGQFPAAWVPEAPMRKAVDRVVAEQLGNLEIDQYFNSGVLLINVSEWRQQCVSERAMKYIAEYQPRFYDQSALNVVLYRNALCLDPCFNWRSNARENWRALTGTIGTVGRLVHFIDAPKPWDFLGEWVHPQFHLWKSILSETAIKDYRSWRAATLGTSKRFAGGLQGYRRSLKDKLLFTAFRRGWVRNVKGVPTAQMQLGASDQ